MNPQSWITNLKLSTDSPVLFFDVDGLPWLNIDSVVITGTFCHGDANSVFIKIVTLSAGAAIHRQEVGGADLLLRAQ